LAVTMMTCGAQVTMASSCEGALDALQQAAAAKTLPHVHRDDLGMPKADGFDLIRKVRSLSPDDGGRIPLVAVTGYVDRRDGQRALEAGFFSHVPKPIDPIAIAVEVA